MTILEHSRCLYSEPALQTFPLGFRNQEEQEKVWQKRLSMF